MAARVVGRTRVRPAALASLAVAMSFGGALWLLLLGLGSALGWSDPWTVSWPGVALPAALLVVGMLVGLLLAHLGRSAGAADAVLRRSLAESRLRSGVEAVADRPDVAAYLVERGPDGSAVETRIEPRLLT